MLEEKLLIWKFKAGNEEALCRIYQKYEDYLLTLAANLLGDASSAEDVVQDVFISFVQSIDKFQLRGSLKSYLSTCVVNRARDFLRKKQRQQTIAVNEADQMRTDADGPVQLVINSEQLQRLRFAMTELPYEQREAIVLRLHGDMKFKTIAKFQDVSIKTVQSRYRYGIDRLRSILDGEVKK